MVNTRRKNKTHGTQSSDNLISLPNPARDSTNFKELANVKSILALTHTGGYRLWKKSFELHFKRHKVVRFIKQDLTGYEEVKTVMLNSLLQKIGKPFIQDVLCFTSPFALWQYLEKRILGSSEIQLLRAIKLLHNIKYTSISQFVINYRKQSSIVASLDSSFSQHYFCLGFLAQLPVSAQRYKHCLMKAEKDDDNRYTSLEELFTLLQEAMPRQEYSVRRRVN